jgi:hypothetical protein
MSGSTTTAKLLIFDNTEIEIQPKHILASSGYPIYGFPLDKARGEAKVLSITKTVRSEIESLTIFQNTDFSVMTVK